MKSFKVWLIFVLFILTLGCSTIPVTTDNRPEYKTSPEYFCDGEYYTILLPEIVPDTWLGGRMFDGYAPWTENIFMFQYVINSKESIITVSDVREGICPGLIGLFYINGEETHMYFYEKGKPVEVNEKEMERLVNEHALAIEDEEASKKEERVL